MRSFGIALLLTLCGLLAAAPLRAPKGLTLDLFATVPIFVFEPQNAAVQPGLPHPDARAILDRVLHNPLRSGMYQADARVGVDTAQYQNTRWLVKGTHLIAVRNGAVTGEWLVTNLAAHSLEMTALFTINSAPGDFLLPRDEFARLAPVLAWQPAEGAEAYRLERRSRGERAWLEVYRGPETRWVDNGLPVRIIDGGDYEYRVSSLAGSSVASAKRLATTTRPLRSPARDLLDTLPFHESKEIELLLSLLAEHPDPAIRFSAAWELSRLPDDRVTRAALDLLHGTNQEMIKYGAMIYRRQQGRPLLPNPEPLRRN
jgi:hypothetical protein